MIFFPQRFEGFQTKPLSQGIPSKKSQTEVNSSFCIAVAMWGEKKKLWELFLELKFLFNEEVYNSIIYCLRFDLSGSLKGMF